MDVRAQLNGLRIAPRKVRLVAGLIRRKDVQAALDQLDHLSNRASRPVSKLVHSAVANAEHNFRMVRSNLYIKEISVDEGVKLRRWQPKGFGRAAAIQKKSSHVNIVLGERQPGLRVQEKPKQDAVPESKPDTAPHQEASTAESDTAPAPVKETPQSKQMETGKGKATKGLKGFGRKLFRRKTI